MKRKIYLILITLLVAFTNATASTRFTVNNLRYSAEDGSTKATIIGYLSGKLSDILNLPSQVTYNGVTYSVTEISEQAFYGCEEFYSLSVPSSVEQIGAQAFQQCTNLQKVDMAKTAITEINKYAFAQCSQLVDVQLPDSLVTIGDYAFSNCTKLTSVYFPKTLTTIKSAAFWYCGLTFAQIPTAVETIGERAFGNCTNMVEICVDNDNQYYTTDQCHVLYDKNMTTLLFAINSLTEYVVPEGVGIIGVDAFSDNTNLKSITLPSTLKKMEYCALRGCTGLTEITLPASLGEMEKGVLDGCSNLQTINVLATTPPSAPSGLFFSTTATIYVPKGTLETYKAASGWSEYASQIKETGTTIENNEDLGAKYADLCCRLKDIYAYIHELYAYCESSGMSRNNSITEAFEEYNAYIDYLQVTLNEISESTASVEEVKNMLEDIQMRIAEIQAIISAAHDNIDQMVKAYSIIAKVQYISTKYEVTDSTALKAVINDILANFDETDINNTGKLFTQLSEYVHNANQYFPEVWILDLLQGNDFETIYANYATSKAQAKYIVAVGIADDVNFATFLNNHSNFTSVDLSSAWLTNFTFKGSQYLQNVILPEELSSLQVGVLDECPNLSTITATRNYPVKITSETFAGVDTSSVILFVPAGYKSNYQNYEGWNSFKYIYQTGEDVVINANKTFEYEGITYELSGDNTLRVKFVPLTGNKRAIIPSVIVINNIFYVVNVIQTGAFKNSEVTSVTFPNTPDLWIQEGAFEYCEYLTETTIPANVTRIDSAAFKHCDNLTKIILRYDLTLDKKGPTIADIFGEQVKEIVLEVNVVELTGDHYKRLPNLEKIVLPSTVKEIGDDVFRDCKSLKYINLPASLKIIGKYAFYNCESLTEITIPDSVVSIGEDAFAGCRSLTKVIINNIYIIENLYLGSNGSFSYIFGIHVKHIVIGKGVKVLRKHLFYDMTGLETVELPYGLTTIEEYAFLNCTNLTTVNIPTTVTVVNMNAFWGCYSFSEILYNEDRTMLVYCNPKLAYKTVTIADGVTTICDGAFAYCEELEEITLPSSVTSIGQNIFYGCKLIVVINVICVVPPTATALSFTDVDTKTVILYVPLGTSNLYALAEGWKEFLNIVEKDFSSSITSVQGDDAVETLYFTTDGKPVSTPAKGMYIVKKKYANGQVETQKVVVK